MAEDYTVLITGLGRLADPLSKLSDKFSDAVKAFLASPQLKQWIDAAADGLERFANYVGSDQFKSDVDSLIKNIMLLSRAIGTAANWIASFGGPAASGGAGSIPTGYRRHGDVFGFGPARPGAEHSGVGNWIQRQREGIDRHFGKSSDAAIHSQRVDTALAFFQKRGLSTDQAAAVVARLDAESGLDPNAVNPKSGALGIAQWLGPRRPAAAITRGDFGKQLHLVWSEFMNEENAAYRQLKKAHGVHGASRAMESFERAGEPLLPREQKAWPKH
jgi:Phage tail lysozyme